jgi:hypothetical protein
MMCGMASVHDAGLREIQTAIAADPGNVALHARHEQLLESASSPLAELARIEVALLSARPDPDESRVLQVRRTQLRDDALRTSQLDWLCGGRWHGAVYDVRRLRPFRLLPEKDGRTVELAESIARVRETAFAVMVELEFSFEDHTTRGDPGFDWEILADDGLRGVLLEDLAMDDAGLLRLVDSGALRSLERFAWSASDGARVSSAVAERFWSAFDPGRLRSLKLWALGHPQLLTTLLETPLCAELRDLGLGYDDWGELHRRLVTSQSWPALSSLSFFCSDFDSSDLVALGRGPLAGSLRSLCLCRSDVDADGWSFASQESNLRELRHLGGGESRFDDRSALALARTSVLERLECLDLTFTRLQKASILALLESEQLPRQMKLRAMLAASEKYDDVLRSHRPRFFDTYMLDSGTLAWVEGDHWRAWSGCT